MKLYILKKLFQKLPFLVIAIIIIATLVCGLAGCKSEPVALTIIKGTQTKTLTMVDVEALPIIFGTTGDMTGIGVLEGPNQYKGVTLTDILNTIGGITENDVVKVSGKDGYAITLSYAQITEGSNFLTCDNSTRKEVSPAGKLTVFLAYEKDGTPLDDIVGPLQLGIMAPGQLTNGSWWVKWVQKIEVIASQ